ncbi:MAG: hypothetical protein U9Q81_03905 [Pseudomonadota bacterium]|nr:hypothetical protein [Pseudomonadota bacterium]
MRLLSNLVATIGKGLLPLFLCWSSVQAAGLMTPSDGSLPALEIRDHEAEVLIQDG